MGLQPTKTVGAPSIPIFQAVDHTLRGGASLDNTGLTDGEILPAGTPITVDEATRVAKVANSNGSDVTGLLYESVIIEKSASVDVVIEGIVYENRIPVIPAAVKTALQGLIIFSKSY